MQLCSKSIQSIKWTTETHFVAMTAGKGCNDYFHICIRSAHLPDSSLFLLWNYLNVGCYVHYSVFLQLIQHCLRKLPKICTWPGSGELFFFSCCSIFLNSSHNGFQVLLSESQYLKKFLLLSVALINWWLVYNLCS